MTKTIVLFFFPVLDDIDFSFALMKYNANSVDFADAVYEQMPASATLAGMTKEGKGIDAQDGFDGKIQHYVRRPGISRQRQVRVLSSERSRRTQQNRLFVAFKTRQNCEWKGFSARKNPVKCLVEVVEDANSFFPQGFTKHQKHPGKSKNEVTTD